MNWLDIVIIIIAVIGAYMGWKQGLIRMAFTIVGLIIGIVLAGQWADPFAEKLSPSGAQWAYFLAFAIILIVILLAANIIGGILHRFLKIIMMGWLDSLGGIVLGFLLGALAIAAILASLGAWAQYLPQSEMLESTMGSAIGGSALAELLIDKFGIILGLLPEKFDAIQDFFQ